MSVGFLGDYAIGNVVYVEACFVDGGTGVPTAVVGGSACVKRMSDQVLGPGCTAITTSGGLATFSITTASSATFFVRGDYSVFMGAGTVTGTSVIGYTLAQFSIGRTTAITVSANLVQWNGTTPNNLISGRVDANSAAVTVSANLTTWLGSAPNALITGRVDSNAAAVTVSANVLQWGSANVSSAASGIPKVDVDTIKTNPVVNGGTITFPSNATLPSTTSTLSANVILWQASAPNVLISGRVDANANAAIATATVSSNVLQISGASVNTSSAQLGVNVVNIGGVAAALATLSATMVGVSTTGSTAIQNSVWDTPIASHAGAGTTGLALSTASSAGDPWGTALPGAYGAGTAGKLIGNAINSTTFTTSATVVTMSASALKNFFDTDSGTTFASAIAGSVVFETADNAGDPITLQQIVDGVWNEPLPGTHTTTSTAGKLIGNAINFTTYTMSANLVSVSTTGSTSIQNAVWDTPIASHAGAGSTGLALSTASSAGDPWGTALPGAYSAGTAGKLLGNAINSSTFTMSANVTSINAVSTSPVTTVKAVQGLTTADTITTVTNLTNAPTVGDFTSTMKTSIQTVVTAVTVSANVKSINGVSTSGVTTVQAVQGLTTADQVTTVSGNVNGNVAGSVGSLTTNNDKTGYGLTSAERNSTADAFLLRDIATGASATDRNVQNTFRAIRNKTTINLSTGALTVFAEDDTSTAWTAVTTTASALSITGVDPA